MSKLELVIVDRDISYLKAFVDFLSTDYNYKFNISHFTDVGYLNNYLSLNSQQVDILLIDNESYDDEILKYGINEIVLMTEGYYKDIYKQLKSVNKYQAGDKLVSDILNCCSDSQNIAASTSKGNMKTKAISVYSPVGGVGKTSISIATAMRCIDKNLKVFYLNLESASSVDVFFDCNATHSFSEILYFLKEKDRNIINKIDALKSVDISTGIHFFGIPDRIFDYDEVDTEDYIKLIESIIEIGIYDYVFIDLTSEISKRNISILDKCDRVVLLSLEDIFSDIKLKKFFNEMQAVDSQLAERVNNNIIKVINKSDEAHNGQGDTKCIRVPAVRDFVSYRQEKALLNLNNEMGASLDKVIGLFNSYKE